MIKIEFTKKEAVNLCDILSIITELTKRNPKLTETAKRLYNKIKRAYKLQ